MSSQRESDQPQRPNRLMRPAVAIPALFDTCCQKDNAAPGNRSAAVNFCTNPLRTLPHPRITLAVIRFGLCGLLVCALCAALSRGWKLTRAAVVLLVLSLSGCATCHEHPVACAVATIAVTGAIIAATHHGDAARRHQIVVPRDNTPCLRGECL